MRHNINNKNIRFNRYKFEPYIKYIELKGLDYINRRRKDNNINNQNLN